MHLASQAVIVGGFSSCKERHMPRLMIATMGLLGLLAACTGGSTENYMPMMDSAYSNSIGFTGLGDEPF